MISNYARISRNFQKYLKMLAEPRLFEEILVTESVIVRNIFL